MLSNALNGAIISLQEYLKDFVSRLQLKIQNEHYYNNHTYYWAIGELKLAREIK